MRRILPLLATLTVAATATAAVEFFFTASHDIYGLQDRSLAFQATKGNGTDLSDGFELTKGPSGYLNPPLICPMPDVVIDPNANQWAYIWARFVDEPLGAKINGIAIEIKNADAGQGNIAWYKCDNLLDFNLPLPLKRWDGDNNVFYFNPAGLIAITAFGVVNSPNDNPPNLYIGGDCRTFLLGAVRFPNPPRGPLEFAFGPTGVSYATPPDPEVRVCNKVVPEPASLALLVLAALIMRRR